MDKLRRIVHQKLKRIMSDATDNPSLVWMVVLSYLLTNNYFKKLKLFQLLSLISGLLVYTKQTVRDFYMATALHLAWANSGHLETLPLVSPRNDVCETSAETSRAALLQPIKSITQIWVVTRHQNVIYSAISALVSQASFPRETREGVVKCRLFSKATVHPGFPLLKWRLRSIGPSLLVPIVLPVQAPQLLQWCCYKLLQCLYCPLSNQRTSHNCLRALLTLWAFPANPLPVLYEKRYIILASP